MKAPIQAPGERTLTDADVDAIVSRAEEALAAKFYSNLGRGLWSLAWKAVVVAIVGIAAYGAWSGKH